jgi:hypothetical protein
MPLQIRRGTDAERSAMTQPLAAGELLYVTNTQKIYVGDNNTLGGIQVTGYTDNDAKNATAAAFAGGSHTSISFSYNTTTKTISANVDLSNYQGNIKASAFTGSVFADDGSTLNSQPLVDAISGTFNGNLVGNVTGNVTGNITGNIFTNLIDSANSSAIAFTPSVVFNSDVTVENELFANMTGNVLGNIQGNVTNIFGSAIVDVSNATFNGAGVNLDTNGTITSLGSISFSAAAVLLTVVDPVLDAPNTSIFVQNNAGTHTAPLGLSRIRGTYDIPTTVFNGDELGRIVSAGHDGTGFVLSSSVEIVVDGAVSAGIIPSRIDISTSNSTGTRAVKASIKSSMVEFVVPPKLPVVANDTARTALVPTPTTGMMIFMTSGTSPAATNKVQVYDSTAWVNLH